MQTLTDHYTDATIRLSHDQDQGFELLSPTQLAKYVPRVRGTKVSSSTIVRWIERGKCGVRLDGTRGTGSGWFSSRAALVRFQSALAQQISKPAPIPTPTQHERQLQRDRELLQKSLGEFAKSE